MAAQAPKKKVRRTVTDGIAHVHASFNNTIVMITDRAKAMRCHGRLPVVQAFGVLVKAHHLLLR